MAGREWVRVSKTKEHIIRGSGLIETFIDLFQRFKPRGGLPKDDRVRKEHSDLYRIFDA
jgi:hypothetical protein